jgi:ClpP class serine protease
MRELLAGSPVELIHFTAGTLASMGYRLATTGQIFATPSSILGCVGTIAVYTDSSVAASNAGLQVLAFTSDGTGNPSPLKALGNPGVAITEDQKAFVQNRVHESAAIFRAEVLAAFPRATGDAMRGGWVYGSQAVTDNLITGTVPNLETLIAAI